MNLHPFGHAMELLRVADAMSIRASILPKDEGKAFILSVLERFKPWKKRASCDWRWCEENGDREA